MYVIYLASSEKGESMRFYEKVDDPVELKKLEDRMKAEHRYCGTYASLE